MKAAELDGLRIPVDPSDNESSYYYIHPQKIPVVKAFEAVGQSYERTINDRVWDIGLSLVTADPVKDQAIKKVIPQVYRTKDPADGKEWLFYNVDMSGKDWKGNRKDYSYVEGLIEGLPIFNYEIDPRTQKVISGTTQVEEVTRKYTIPFSKSAVDEISKYFRNPLSCVVVALDGRRYSCSIDEFRDMSYNELVKEKIGINEYFRSKRGAKVYT